MKPLKLLFPLVIIFHISIQAQVIHDAKILTIIPVGNHEIAAIQDLVSSKVYKTSLHSSGQLQVADQIKLELSNSHTTNKAKVIKTGLIEEIYGFCESSHKSVQEIVSIVNEHKEQLKTDLNLIAKALAGLLDNSHLIEIIKQEIDLTRMHQLTFIRLSQLYSKQTVTLEQELIQSLQNQGSTEFEINRLSEILFSINLEEGLMFETKIDFPTANTESVFELGNSGWDGKTPCLTGVSLFHMDDNTMPVYKFSSSNEVKIGELSHREAWVIPTLHISLIPNFNIKQADENGYIELNATGELIGERKEIVTLFKSMQGCDCVTNTGMNGEELIVCEGEAAGEMDCSPDGSVCERLCQIASTLPVIQTCPSIE